MAFASAVSSVSTEGPLAAPPLQPASANKADIAVAQLKSLRPKRFDTFMILTPHSTKRSKDRTVAYEMSAFHPTLPLGSSQA